MGLVLPQPANMALGFGPLAGLSFIQQEQVIAGSTGLGQLRQRPGPLPSVASHILAQSVWNIYPKRRSCRHVGPQTCEAVSRQPTMHQGSSSTGCLSSRSLPVGSKRSLWHPLRKVRISKGHGA